MAKATKRIVSILLGFIILLCCTACDDAKIQSFSINDLPDKSIGVGMVSDELKVEVDYFRSFQTSDVNVVIEDNSIISIDYEAKESLMSGYYVSYTITGLQAGTTSYFFETADHMIKSDKVEIEVVDDVPSNDVTSEVNEKKPSIDPNNEPVIEPFVESEKIKNCLFSDTDWNSLTKDDPERLAADFGLEYDLSMGWGGTSWTYYLSDDENHSSLIFSFVSPEEENFVQKLKYLTLSTNASEDEFLYYYSSWNRDNDDDGKYGFYVGEIQFDDLESAYDCYIALADK